MSVVRSGTRVYNSHDEGDVVIGLSRRYTIRVGWIASDTFQWPGNL